MAAGVWVRYSNFVLGMTKKLFDLSSDTFVLTLVTSSYTPVQNTHTLWSDVSANELGTAGGYTAGGIVLGSMTDTLTTATVTWTCASPKWTTFTAGPFRYGVLVKRASGSLAAGDLLVAYSDLGGGSNITGTGGDYTVTISGSGVLTFA